jgi:hypothetical protein
MDRKTKRAALRSLLLATLFYLFFQASKHIPTLARVNPFADDPYDAVGSFTMQLAPFLALLSCLRAFRPYRNIALSNDPQRLIAQTRLLTAIAISLTMLSNMVALARHPHTWISSQSGRWLAIASLAILLWSAVEGYRAAKQSQQSFSRSAWMKSITAIIAMVTALAAVPETLRHTIAGVLLTAFTGGLTLIVPLGIIARQLAAHHRPAAFDLVDDVIAVWEAIKSATPRLAPVYTALDWLQRARWPHCFALWINPRQFRWRLPLLSGAIFGLALVTAEFCSEGLPHLALVLPIITIFIGLETASVLMGYAALAEPIGLFRRKAH